MKRLEPYRLFQGLPEHDLQEITVEAEHLAFEQGEVIVPPDSSSRELFVVMRGAAALRHAAAGVGEDNLDVFTAGAAFGQWSATDPPPEARHSLVVALSHTRVLRLPEPWLGEFLRRCPVFAVNLAASLSDRLTRLECRVRQEYADRGAFLSGGGPGSAAPDIPFQALSESSFFRRHEAEIRQAAASGEPVLISGEPGVGKFQLCRILFRFASTNKGVLLTANLYDPETYLQMVPGRRLTDQEVLFGAGDGKSEFPGMVEMARNGTLFLMGPEQLSLEVQHRLLRYILDQRFPTQGGSWTPGVRIIAATTRDPASLVAEGKLLPSLLECFRDRHFPIPPLRGRKRDIPDLAAYYVQKFAAEVGKEVGGLSDAAIKSLLDHSWPGNDTEFAEIIRRGVILTDSRTIHPEDLFLHFTPWSDLGKINLLRQTLLGKIYASPFFPTVAQWMVAPFFFILLAFLLMGSPNPDGNLGAVFSWALGWPMMVIGSFLWARFWCTVCPMGSSGAFVKQFFSLNRPLPHFFKVHSTKIVAAMALFIMWLEMVTEMRAHPARLGILLTTFVVLSIFFAVVFERQGWCAYLCGLGGMMGLFSRVSPLELRADRNVCQARCTGHQCYTGSEQRAGCPFFLHAPAISSNVPCRLCGICVKNCPHGSIALSLRHPGQELWEITSGDIALSLFVAAMLGALLCEFHLPYPTLPFLDAMGHTLRVTLLFTAFTVGSVLALALASVLGSLLGPEPYRQHLHRYGQAYLPLVLCGFIAYHGYYLATLSPPLLRHLASVLGAESLSQVFWTMPDPAILFLQRLFLAAGLLGTCVVFWKLHRRTHAQERRLPLEIVPHLLLASQAAWALQQAIQLHFFGHPL
jgi:CRP-like cAMP-binding protein/ferredoxin